MQARLAGMLDQLGGTLHYISMGARQDLEQTPSRFAFDAALRVLMHDGGTADPARAARFTSPPQLAYQASEIIDVTSVEGNLDDKAGGGAPRVQTSVIGLAGPAGALPRGYTEMVTQAARNRSRGLQAFLDLLAQRFVAAYGAAGAKYRPARAAEASRLSGAPDPSGAVLLAVTGYGNVHLGVRLAAGEAALQHYAGFFSFHQRSADRLAALASDWLGRNVRVRQFAGAWLDLPVPQRTALPRGRGEGAYCRLGADAACGVRAWDIQARIVLVVGPLDLLGFEALLPGGADLGRFVALMRAFLGFETGFAVNLILLREAVPPLRLLPDVPHPPRLGWNSWLTAPVGSRLRDPDDALFEADTVEAEMTEAKLAKAKIAGAAFCAA